MKKLISIMMFLALLTVAVVGCAEGFDAGRDITVISREDGSGTRSAFIELFGIEEKDADGNKVDMTTEDAVITNSTAVCMTSVSGNEYAMGYISLGSLDDTVKALTVDGVEATAQNIRSGDYAISRPFNIATKADASDLAKDFIAYILSLDGQAIVTENGYVTIADADSAAYSGSAISGKLVVAGSSSVMPLMEKLAEAYKGVNPNAEIEVQQSDSTTGISSVVDGVCDIGMASRNLKDSETEAGLTATGIAMDGIAVIVNKDNPLSDVSKDVVRAIYTGEMTKWSEVMG